MIDREINRYIDNYLNPIANSFYKIGVAANWITFFGLVVAFICFAVLSYGLFYLGLILILINRFLDGLDGRLARLGTPRKFGAFFDITSDFAFYALIPLGFAVFSPYENALPTAFLLAAFYVNGSSFLAEAVIIENIILKLTKRIRDSFTLLD